MRWYLRVIQKYADFEGRARRKEFWMFMFVHALVSMACGFLDVLLGTWSDDLGSGLFVTVYNFAVLIPVVAVSVRRLHDVGRSGWWYLIWFVPGIGWLIFLVMMLIDSDEGPNEYGPNPKQEQVMTA